MLKQTLASLVLATSLIACADRGAPQVIAIPTADLDKAGHMSVTGTATMEVSPDSADLTMTIAGDGARPGQAASSVERKKQELIDALGKLGLESRDMKLSHLRLDPVYAINADGVQMHRITGYRAELVVTATTKRFDLVGSIMEAGANAGVSSMSSQFRRSDLPELKKQVRDLALKAAKDKAAQTAKALGIELGRVVTVVEAPNGALWTQPNFLANEAVQRTSNVVLGGSLQTLTLDITIGFELSKRA